MGRPDFPSLLGQSKQLASSFESQNIVLQRGLEQLNDATKKLASKAPTAPGDISKSKAYYFLLETITY
jgi:hypothetical protein